MYARQALYQLSPIPPPPFFSLRGEGEWRPGGLMRKVQGTLGSTLDSGTLPLGDLGPASQYP